MQILVYEDFYNTQGDEYLPGYLTNHNKDLINPDPNFPELSLT
jgi:hypothetical protein